MVIQKVINNNVISAYDENQQEVVIMGKGIGFKAHTGDAIDESRVEKVFRIENEKLSRQFQEILENIPLEHMQLTSDIITYAKKESECTVESEYLYHTDGSYQFCNSETGAGNSVEECIAVGDQEVLSSGIPDGKICDQSFE